MSWIQLKSIGKIKIFNFAWLKSFKSEGKCKFKEDCAYKHIVNKESITSIKHAQEVVNLQQQQHNDVDNPSNE